MKYKTVKDQSELPPEITIVKVDSSLREVHFMGYKVVNNSYSLELQKPYREEKEFYKLATVTKNFGIKIDYFDDKYDAKEAKLNIEEEVNTAKCKISKVKCYVNDEGKVDEEFLVVDEEVL